VDLQASPVAQAARERLVSVDLQEEVVEQESLESLETAAAQEERVLRALRVLSERVEGLEVLEPPEARVKLVELEAQEQAGSVVALARPEKLAPADQQAPAE
jgi:hypothetical protein